MSAFHGFPRLLVLLRERAGKTQADAGEAVGRSYSAVSAWERGDVSPTIDQVDRLLDFYGVRSFAELQRVADALASGEEAREPHFRPDDVARAFPSSPADLHRRLADLYEEIETVTRRLSESRAKEPKE